MTQIDHWYFFSSLSSKNDEDETETVRSQHLAFSSVSSFQRPITIAQMPVCVLLSLDKHNVAGGAL